MKIKFIEPSYKISMPDIGLEMLKHIELAGRTCYKSEDKITKNTTEAFIRMIIKRGHESVLEHASFSVRFVCDRGISHELVRHRLASFSQESTRYVGYKEAIEFVIPSWMNIEPFEWEGYSMRMNNSDGFSGFVGSWQHPNVRYNWGQDSPEFLWVGSMGDVAKDYELMLRVGQRPEQARSVLPNSLKTEIVVTANLREWRHILKLRCSDAAHPDMKAIMRPLLAELKLLIPVVFEDL